MAPDDSAEPQEADGQATALTGVGTMVLTADCLPVAVAAEGAVAMLHAGWRGLAGGVIDGGVRAVRELGGEGAIAAAIGPGAGPCCYEVGDEVHARFAQLGPRARNGDNLDLKAIARAQLLEAGVAEVHDAGMCTICSDPSLFFSHRRDHGLTGRQGGVAWRS
jgi:YfiH family protein